MWHLLGWLVSVLSATIPTILQLLKYTPFVSSTWFYHVMNREMTIKKTCHIRKTIYIRAHKLMLLTNDTHLHKKKVMMLHTHTNFSLHIRAKMTKLQTLTRSKSTSCLAASDVSLCDWLKKWKIGRTEYSLRLPSHLSTSSVAEWLRAGASFSQYRWFKTHREQLLQTVSPAFKPFPLRCGDFLFFSSALLICITTQPYLQDKMKPHKYNGT